MSVAGGSESGSAQSEAGADARHQSSDWKASAPAAGFGAGSSSCRTGDRSIWSRSSLLERSIRACISLGLPAVPGVNVLRYKQNPYQGCIKKPIFATENSHPLSEKRRAKSRLLILPRSFVGIAPTIKIRFGTCHELKELRQN